MRLVPKILASLVLLCVCDASGATLKTLYSFCAKTACADGKAPLGGVMADASGNLYGTTVSGGRFAAGIDGGTAFELAKSGGGWTHKVLHHFCAQPACADGSRPFAGLIQDAAGNLYGVATGGGANGFGVAFELIPHGRSWGLTVLYDFCSVGGTRNCNDGASPFSLTYAGAASGAPYDGVSPLYGVTTAGGNANNGGIVFELTFAAGTWHEAVLHSFCAEADCSDGRLPEAGLLVDGEGHLFGTTTGSNGHGVAFELTKGSADDWSETVLHDFCPAGPCADAMFPDTVMIMDGAGNLYGASEAGGGYHTSSNGSGAVFKIVPDGTSSQESVLHAFCALSKCADGRAPSTDLVMDASGNLFGGTSYGGTHIGPGGVMFELNDTYQVVYKFCSVKKCRDGALPQGHVIMDGAGDLFGTTRSGGLHGGSDPRHEDSGTVYELTP